MSTSGEFVSVLDNRSSRQLSRIHADHITRHRSRSAARDDDEDMLEVIPRVPQPYRTSLSAVTAPMRIWTSDRTRSISPSLVASTTSSRSRSKSPHVRKRKKSSPKHVTYDEKVTVRHSDTEESVLTDLSGRDEDLEHSPRQLSSFEVSPRLKTWHKNSPENAQVSFSSVSDDTSMGDYSADLQKLSPYVIKQINGASLLEQNTRGQIVGPSPITVSPPANGRSPTTNSMPNITPKPLRTRLPSEPIGLSVSQATGDSGVYTSDEANIPVKPHRTNIQRDYVHDRTVSYRKAIHAHYSDEVRRLAEVNFHELVPDLISESCLKTPPNDPKADEKSHSPEPEIRAERSNTMPGDSSMDNSKPLSGSKRSLSSSIGNFFKRISPNLRRKPGKSSTSSAEGSEQSLSVSEAGSMDSEQSGNQLSRGKGRRSLTKLLGRMRSRASSKSRDNAITTPQSPHDDQEKVTNEKTHRQLPDSTNRILKSIEQNTSVDRNIYHKFKEKSSSSSERSLSSPKPQALKASPDANIMRQSQNCSSTKTEMNKENELTFHEGSVIASTPYRDDDAVVTKVDPPKSLNVHPLSRPGMKPLQMSFMSVGSVGDESIGECSLDMYREGSEASLATNGQPVSLSGSKKVVLSQDNILGDVSRSPSVTLSQQPKKYTPSLGQPVSGSGTASTGELKTFNLANDTNLPTAAPSIILDKGSPSWLPGNSVDMPILIDSDSEFAGQEFNRMPSYLKLSCALSGYGKYCSYKQPKDLEKPSFTSSLSISIKSDGSISSTESLPDDLLNSKPSQERTSIENGDGVIIETTRKQNGCKDSTVGNCENNNNNEIELSKSGVTLVNGHRSTSSCSYPTGDSDTDASYYLEIVQTEEDRLHEMSDRAQVHLDKHSLCEEVSGKIRTAIGKSNLLTTKKFKQFRELCSNHQTPSVSERPTKWEDLQGFWDMVQIQVDNVYDLFGEIELWRQHEWTEPPARAQSPWNGSANSSPQSPSLSVTSSISTTTPTSSSQHTPQDTPKQTPASSRRRVCKSQDSLDGDGGSSSEKSKAKQTAKARDDARRRLLAEKRAAMKKQAHANSNQNSHHEVEIFVNDAGNAPSS